MNVLFNGRIDLKDLVTDNEFHQKLKKWINENGWDYHSSSIFKEPVIESMITQTGIVSAVFHPEYRRVCNYKFGRSCGEKRGG